MKAELQWKEKMHFVTRVGEFNVDMDATPPFGESKYPSPKQLLLASMAGCTAMDVVSLMKKYKQPMTGLKMDLDADVVKEHPQVFRETVMHFKAEGDIDPNKLIEAVKLSLSKYCSVNAMVSGVVKIVWKASINGAEVGSGPAEFSF